MHSLTLIFSNSDLIGPRYSARRIRPGRCGAIGELGEPAGELWQAINYRGGI